MNLKARLARLEGAAGRPHGADVAVAATPPVERVPASVADARDETLAALRRKMALILGTTAKGEPPVLRAADGEPTLGDLPFAREETPRGPLFQRTEHRAPSHHVGRMPLDAALAADARALSLLALDPSLAAATVSGALFLDTETTGLGGGAGTVAFLVGLGWFEDGALVVEQILLRAPSEEEPLLRRVRERVERASFLVTFNGKAFDWPLLKGRFVMNRLEPPGEKPHLDLLHVARRLHRARIRACTLRAVESEVLGFSRDQDIDGGDVAPRYAHFLRTGDPTPLGAVVEHNTWDVVSMAALVGLYGEPLGPLHVEDLVGLARTYHRARAFDEAERAADEAITRGARAAGLKVRGQIAKARGDRARALRDFEELVGTVDDPGVRLELAKLYEHFVKQPEQALRILEQGTNESPEAVERRRARLERKVRARRAGG